MDKSEIIAKFARSEGDTGSPEVQIALLTARIEALNAHDRKLGDRPDASDSKPKLLTDKEFWL